MIDTCTLMTVITFIVFCGGIWYENAQQEDDLDEGLDESL